MFTLVSIVDIDTVLFLSLIIVLKRNVESNRVKNREHVRKSARSNDNKEHYQSIFLK